MNIQVIARPDGTPLWFSRATHHREQAEHYEQFNRDHARLSAPGERTFARLRTSACSAWPSASSLLGHGSHRGTSVGVATGLGPHGRAARRAPLARRKRIRLRPKFLRSIIISGFAFAEG